MRKWLSIEAAGLYGDTLATMADVRPDPAPVPTLTRDPDDEYVIHFARAHKAEVILVSGV